MVGGAVIARVHGIHVEYLLQWSVDFERQRSDIPLPVALHGDAEDLSCAEIVDQDSVDLLQLRCMIGNKCVCTHPVLLLPGEQDECDGTLGLPSQSFQGARSFEHRHGSSPVVHRALAEVPGIEVAADDHALVRKFAALDLGDCDGSLHRAGAEGSGQVELHLHRPRSAVGGGELIKQRIIFMGKKSHRDLRGFVVAAKRSHVEQAVKLPTIHQDGRGLLLINHAESRGASC